METAKQTQKPKRPVGRPRANGKAQLDRSTLLLGAAKLIAANGYSGTSIRMIASELDVSTASIFHLFPTKDALLNALIAFVAAPSLKFYLALSKEKVSAAAALHKSVFEETKAVQSVDRDYVAMFYLPELRKPEFAEARQVRARMVDHYAKLIKDGVDQGIFRNVDPAYCAEQVFQLSETSLLAGRLTDPKMILARARETAAFCLRGLLVCSDDLDSIQRVSEILAPTIEIEL